MRQGHLLRLVPTGHGLPVPGLAEMRAVGLVRKREAFAVKAGLQFLWSKMAPEPSSKARVAILFNRKRSDRCLSQ